VNLAFVSYYGTSLTVFRKCLNTHLFNCSFPNTLSYPHSDFVTSGNITDLLIYLFSYYQKCHLLGCISEETVQASNRRTDNYKHTYSKRVMQYIMLIYNLPSY